MSGKKSKNKGANFEREIAKKFSIWWGGEFKRTPLSGGWGHAQTKGDIVYIPKPNDKYIFPFSIECKRNESFNYHTLLIKDPKILTKWWRQAKDGGLQDNKIPLLIVKINLKEPFICFDHTEIIWALLKRHNNKLSYATVYISDNENDDDSYINNNNLYITTLKHFFWFYKSDLAHILEEK